MIKFHYINLRKFKIRFTLPVLNFVFPIFTLKINLLFLLPFLYCLQPFCDQNMVDCYNSTKSWRGYIFIAVCLCVCLSVCLSVCVCVRFIPCEQISSRTDTSIWNRFSLNGCLPHWLKFYWNWWPWVKGQGQVDNIHFFLH